MHISIKWFDDRFNFSLHSKPDADEFLTVKGCKIMDSDKGRFVSGPSSKSSETGKWWNHTFMSQAFQAKLIEEAEKARPKARQPEPAGGGYDDSDDIPFRQRIEPC